MTQSPDCRAGLEAAAGICKELVTYYKFKNAHEWAEGADACYLGITTTAAAIEQSQPQEVQPVAYGKWAENSDRLAKYDGVPRVSFTQSEHFNIPLYTHPYDPAALTAAGFDSVEDLLAAWQGTQKDAALLHCALKFANDCINDAFEGCDIDGGDIQLRAASVGLLREETMPEECGEHCSCADVTSFPTVCYRKTYLHLIAAAPAPEAKS